MITEIMGNCPQVKVIELLVSHPWSEFTKSEIAEGASIGRPTLYRFFDELKQKKLVIPTRKIGNTQLYQLNNSSPIVKAISSFQMSLADIQAETQVSSFDEDVIELDDEMLDYYLNDDTSIEEIKFKESNYLNFEKSLEMDSLFDELKTLSYSINEYTNWAYSFENIDEVLKSLKKMHTYEFKFPKDLLNIYLDSIETEPRSSGDKKELFNIELSPSKNLIKV